jgi:hypothetical protein
MNLTKRFIFGGERTRLVSTGVFETSESHEGSLESAAPESMVSVRSEFRSASRKASPTRKTIILVRMDFTDDTPEKRLSGQQNSGMVALLTSTSGARWCLGRTHVDPTVRNLALILPAPPSASQRPDFLNQGEQKGGC